MESGSRAGDDTLFGEDGADRLHGGDGDDRLEGEVGWDSLFGGPGDDKLYGGRLIGNVFDHGRDTDYLEGGPGADEIVGGIGSDTASYRSSNAGVAVRLNSFDNPAQGGHAEGDMFSDLLPVT